MLYTYISPYREKDLNSEVVVSVNEEAVFLEVSMTLTFAEFSLNTIVLLRV